MIDLYTWTTPNGEKPMIMLEECGLDYALNLVDITAGEQTAPDFTAISPNGKIPAIVDRDNGQSLFESGAILVYLAEKAGRFLPPSGPERAETFAWTFFQVGHTGPMLGQWHHFHDAAPEKIPYAIERYRSESLRVLGVLDERLRHRDYLAGDYSIADIMNFGWARIGVSGLGLKDEGAGEMEALKAWIERVGSREPVKTALHKLDHAKRHRS